MGLQDPQSTGSLFAEDTRALAEKVFNSMTLKAVETKSWQGFKRETMRPRYGPLGGKG